MMGEWKRLFSSWKFAAVLVLLFVLHLFLYLFTEWKGYVPLEEWLDGQRIYREQIDTYQKLPIQEAYEQAQADREEARTIEDWKTYEALEKCVNQMESLAGWEGYLKGVQDSADRVLQFSIFQDSGGYTYKNTIKTAREYEALHDVNLVLGHDDALTSILQSVVTDYMLVLWMLLFVMSFLQERRRGLWAMIYATPRGRGQLGLRRIGVLFVAAISGTFLLVGGGFSVGCAIYGIPEMNRAVQSIPLLQGITQEWSVGSFIWIYFLTKGLAVFMMGLFLYAILSLFRSLPAAIVTLGIVMGAEYVLYWGVQTQSPWAVVKYGNLAALIETGSLFTRYLNVNLFTVPVSIRTIGWFLIGVVTVLSAGVVIWNQRWKRPAGHKNVWERFVMIKNRCLDTLWTRCPLWLSECYKVLFLQRGWLVWSVLALWMLYGALGVPVVETTEESLANQFCEQHMGPVEEETRAAATLWAERIQERIEERNQLRSRYEAGELSAGEYDSAMNEYSGLDIQQGALYIVQDRIQQAEAENVWLISNHAIERYFSPSAYSGYQLAMGVLLLELAITLGGIQASEEENGVRNMVRAAYWGRSPLWRAKAWAVFVLSSLCVILYTIVEARQLIQVLPVGIWAAPAASVGYFREIPRAISLAGLYGILFTLRLVMVWSVAGLILCISGWCKQTNVGQGAAVILFGVPAFLGYVGVAGMQIVSPAGAISGWMLFETGIGFWAYGLWMILGLAGWIAARRHWT